MAVLPESMNRLDPSDAGGSLAILENYIRYMGERLEFAMGNMTRTVSAAGVSSAEVYILLTAAQNEISAMKSELGTLTGRLTDLAGRMVEAETTLARLTQTVTQNGQAVAALQEELVALKERLTALEGPETPEE